MYFNTHPMRLLILISIISLALTSTVHITTTTNTNQFAKVILQNDTRMPPWNSDNGSSLYLEFTKDVPTPFWGLNIELKADLYGFRENMNSTIVININNVVAPAPNDQLDLITAFSVNDKYFANFNNIDENYGGNFELEPLCAPTPSPSNGQYIYPECLGTLSQKSNLESVFSTVPGNGEFEYETALVSSNENACDLYRVTPVTGNDGFQFGI